MPEQDPVRATVLRASFLLDVGRDDEAELHLVGRPMPPELEHPDKYAGAAAAILAQGGREAARFLVGEALRMDPEHVRAREIAAAIAAG